MQACLLIYDVPTGAIPMNQHPCVRLRSIAIRLQLSGWVILEGNIPYNYLTYLTEKGCTWDVIKFDQGENKKLIQKAIQSTKNEIRATIKSARDSFQSSCQALNAEDMVPEDKAKRFDRQTKATIKRLKATLADLRKAASTFGIDDNDLNIVEAYQQVNTVQAAVSAKAAEYTKAINQLAKLPGNHSGMLSAARSDQVPAGILADYLDDSGGNGSRLRNLFD